jgi:CHASE1-domain containing sensor protein
MKQALRDFWDLVSLIGGMVLVIIFACLFLSLAIQGTVYFAEKLQSLGFF